MRRFLLGLWRALLGKRRGIHEWLDEEDDREVEDYFKEREKWK